MMRSCLLILALSCALVACGSSASIGGLRCQKPCQDNADPFLLLLEADFEDPDGEFNGGVLLVRIDNQPLAPQNLDPLVNPTGVLRFGVPLPFESYTEGQRFTVHVQASHNGHQTSSTKLPFTIHL